MPHDTTIWSKKYPPVGRCIYCGSRGDPDLGEEHIIPYSLNGTLVLPAASCHGCEGTLSSVEGHCARDMFGILRARYNYRTYRRKSRRTAFPIYYDFGTHQETRLTPAKHHPLNVVMPKFRPPGIIDGRQPTRDWGRLELLIIGRRRIETIGERRGEFRVHLNPRTLTRMLAKIAHGVAVGEFGLSGFRPFLLKHILENDPFAPHLIGCERKIVRPDKEVEHDVRGGVQSIGGKDLIVCRIKLFAYLPTPTYIVVVGERLASSKPSELAFDPAIPHQHTA